MSDKAEHRYDDPVDASDTTTRQFLSLLANKVVDIEKNIGCNLSPNIVADHTHTLKELKNGQSDIQTTLAVLVSQNDTIIKNQDSLFTKAKDNADKIVVLEKDVVGIKTERKTGIFMLLTLGTLIANIVGWGLVLFQIFHK